MNDVIDTTAIEVAPKDRGVQAAGSGLLAGIVPPGEILAVIAHVHAIVKGAMKEGIDGDYGVIPGTSRDGKEPKKVLLKPGAEKLLLAFSLTAIPRPPIVRELGDGHREIIVETEIRSMTTGRLHAVGLGSCSTKEKKYRWRPGPVEITDKPVPREYWDTRKSDPAKAQLLIGGPGHSTKKDENGNWMIALKGDDVAENPDIADVYNTVLKISSKRSMVDGTIRATATSALFTQDLDDDLGKKPESNGNGAATGDGQRQQGRQGSTGTGAAPPTGDGTAKGVVTEVTSKAGKSAKGPWTRYGIKIGGIFYNTFSDTHGAEAQRLKGAEVVITWKANGEYRDLVSIAGAPAESTQAESATADGGRTAEDEKLDREMV